MDDVSGPTAVQDLVSYFCSVSRYSCEINTSGASSEVHFQYIDWLC